MHVGGDSCGVRLRLTTAVPFGPNREADVDGDGQVNYEVSLLGRKKRGLDSTPLCVTRDFCSCYVFQSLAPFNALAVVHLTGVRAHDDVWRH